MTRALFARAAVSAALERRPPVPLALREVVRAVEVPGLGVLRPGQAVAVELGLRAAPQRLRRRRVRLAWGLERLLVEARAGARGGGA